MIRALLLDLDNTLLTNDMNRFIPAYLKLLSAYAAERYQPALLIQHLLAATGEMAANTDPTATNEEAFWREFCRLTGFDKDQMTPFFARFYETRFNDLQALTEPRPEARMLVAWALEQGLRVVVATNPMFPRIAVDRRLAWAGVGADHFAYDLVTSYENMHATKPHLSYYQEILGYLGCQPGETLMVGDDWELDILPASQLGIRAYWIDPPETTDPDGDVRLIGRGTLAEFWLACQEGMLESA